MDKNTLSKLRWQCRRGMLELDLLLNRFVEHEAETLSAEEIERFKSLLEQPDPVLYAWLLGTEKSQSPYWDSLLERLRSQDFV